MSVGTQRGKKVGYSEKQNARTRKRFDHSRGSEHLSTTYRGDFMGWGMWLHQQTSVIVRTAPRPAAWETDRRCSLKRYRFLECNSLSSSASFRTTGHLSNHLKLRNREKAVWCGSVDWVLACEPESQVWFPVRAHAWVVGQVPSRGHVRGNHTLMFLSLSFSFPSSLSENKHNLKKKKKKEKDP